MFRALRVGFGAAVGATAGVVLVASLIGIARNCAVEIQRDAWREGLNDYRRAKDDVEATTR